MRRRTCNFCREAVGGETAGETARDGRGRRRGPSMPRAATLVIDGPSGDSTDFVGLLTSQRFLAVFLFLLIGVLFIFLSLLLFQFYHS